VEPVVFPADAWSADWRTGKEPRELKCPEMLHVLANEAVINGGYCWRHEDTLVESRR